MSLELDPLPPGHPRSVGSTTGGADDALGLGVAVTPSEALRYLTDLGGWIDERRRQLDAIDNAALNAPSQTDRDALTRDMTTSMALWKAIADRYELLKVTFDSGRVGPVQAQRLSTLIWGRLDVSPSMGAPTSPAPASQEGTLGVSLPEACRLSDAMTSSLRARLAL